jgi:hypothetical protein
MKTHVKLGIVILVLDVIAVCFLIVMLRGGIIMSLEGSVLGIFFVFMSGFFFKWYLTSKWKWIKAKIYGERK